MNTHLTENEKIDYILSGAKILSPSKQLHLESCKLCKKEITEQVAIDNLFSKLSARKTISNIFDNIEPNLVKVKFVKNRDWFFLITLITLIIVAFSFVFQKTNATGFSSKQLLTPVVKIVDQNLPEIKIDWKDPLENASRMLTTFFEKNLGSNPSVRMALVIVAAMLFYIIIDHQIVKRRKI